MKRLHLVFLVALCLGLPRAVAVDEKKCVFSIEVVADGGGLHRPGDTAIGDFIRIYEQADGGLYAERYESWHGLDSPRPPTDEFWGAGKEFTARVREAFRTAHLNNSELGKALAESKDLSVTGIVVVGSRTVEIHADLEGTSFSIRSDAVRSLDYYTPKNPVLLRFKVLLEQIASEYGRTKLLL